MYTSAYDKIAKALAPEKDCDSALRCTVEILKSEIPHYHWVGIYLLEPGGEHLQLHNYLGRPTPHTRIQVSEGICGAAIREGDTVVVDDVTADPRYLACSLETKSEIVVPIQSGNRSFGEIDIDSDDVSAFGDKDRELLQKVADLLVPFFS